MTVAWPWRLKFCSAGAVSGAVDGWVVWPELSPIKAREAKTKARRIGARGFIHELYRSATAAKANHQQRNYPHPHSRLGELQRKRIALQRHQAVGRDRECQR